MKTEDYTMMQLHDILQKVSISHIPAKDHIMTSLKEAIHDRYLEWFDPERMTCEEPPPAPLQTNLLRDKLINYTIKQLQDWIDCFTELDLCVPRELIEMISWKQQREATVLLGQLIDGFVPPKKVK